MPKDSTKTNAPTVQTQSDATTGTYTSRIIPASPNVAAIEKYVDIPVSNYTGTPNISIPLYTVKTRDLTLPISIDYHGSGIRVEEEASSVGLGWALNAGGVIRHAVLGKDDFDGNFYNSNWLTLKNSVVPANLSTSTNTNGSLCYYYERPNAVFYIPSYTTAGNNLSNLLANIISTNNSLGERHDVERDIFSFSFPGYSGKFIIEPTGSNTYVIRQMPLSDLRIELKNNDITGASGFVITTPDGTQYTFSQVEKQKTWLGNPAKDTGKKYKGAAPNPVWGNPLAGLIEQPEHTGAWYLTEIRSTKSDVISLSYATSTTLVASLPTRTETFITNGDKYGRWNITESATRLVNLQTITFANGTVNFTNASRDDMPTGATRLTGVTVKSTNNSVIKDIQLNQDYFNSGSGSYSFLAKRLKLTSVQDITVPSCMPPYQFSYEESVNLPDKDSYAQDYWGYYNGATANDNASGTPPVDTQFGTQLIGTMLPAIVAGQYKLPFIGADRKPNAAYMRANVLKQITYPTGGTADFNFESHESFNLRYDPNSRYYISVMNARGYNLLGGGLRIGSIKTTSEQNVTQTTTYNYNSSGRQMANLQFADWTYNIGAGTDQQLLYSSSPRYPLGSGAQGNPVGYGTVTVYRGSSTDTEGYSVYEYLNEVDEHAADFCISGNIGTLYDLSRCGTNSTLADYSICDPYGRPVFSNYDGVSDPTIPNYVNPLNGSLWREGHYLGSGSLLKETKNEYEIVNKVRVPNFRVMKRSNILSGFIYYNDSAWPRLKQSIVNDYGAGGNLSVSTTTTTVYGYNSTAAHKQPILVTTIDRSGEKIEKSIQYAPDVASSTLVTEMLKRNLLALPIVESETLIKTDNSRNAVNSIKTDYNLFSNSFIAPEKIYSQIGSSPYILQATFEYAGNGDVSAITERDGIRTTFNYYGDSGKKYLLQNKTVSNQTTSYDYYPLIGISKITDPNNQFTQYQYDGFGRLLTVKDPSNNLLQSHAYKIANTPGCNVATLTPEAPISSTLTPGDATCPGTGQLIYERWDNIGGGAVTDLTNNSRYSGPASFTNTLTNFEAPTNIADNYGVRIRGYICAPKTGQYTFWIAGDDNVSLRLNSNNDSPGGAVQIAYHNDWTSPREWTKIATQKSSPIQLTAGQRYYIEAIMKEGGGGDNLAVGWRIPGEDLNAAPAAPIAGQYLIPFSSCTPPAAPTVTANNNSQICNNTPVTLTASGCSGTLTWSTGAISTTLSVSTAGSYYATCSANGCTSAQSTPINVSACGDSWLTGRYSYSNNILTVQAASSSDVQLKFERQDGTPFTTTNPDNVAIVSGQYYSPATLNPAPDAYTRQWQANFTAPVPGLRLTFKRTSDGTTLSYLVSPLSGDYQKPLSTTTTTGGGDPICTSFAETCSGNASEIRTQSITVPATGNYKLSVHYKATEKDISTVVRIGTTSQAVSYPKSTVYQDVVVGTFTLSAGPLAIGLSSGDAGGYICFDKICITPLSGCTPPAAPTITANNNSQICNNTPVTLTASGCSGTLTWSTGNTGTTLSASTAGTYYATCSANGCTSSASNSINVSSCGDSWLTGRYSYSNNILTVQAASSSDVQLKFERQDGTPFTTTNPDNVAIVSGQYYSPATLNPAPDAYTRQWQANFTAPVPGLKLTFKRTSDGTTLSYLVSPLSGDYQKPLSTTTTTGGGDPICTSFAETCSGNASEIRTQSITVPATGSYKLTVHYKATEKDISTVVRIGTTSQAVSYPKSTVYQDVVVGTFTLSAGPLAIGLSSGDAGGYICFDKICITPLSSCTPPAAPSITANNNSQICNNTPVTLTASGCSGTLTWSTGNTGATLSVNTAGNYSATCSANGCTSSASNSINVSSCGDSWLTGRYSYSNNILTVQAASSSDVQLKFERQDGTPFTTTNPDNVAIVSGQYYSPATLNPAPDAYTRQWQANFTAPVPGLKLTFKRTSDGATLSYLVSPLSGDYQKPLSTTTTTGGGDPICTSFAETCSGNASEIRTQSITVPATGSYKLTVHYKATEKDISTVVRIGTTSQAVSYPKSTVYQDVVVGTFTLSAGPLAIGLSSGDAGGYICFDKICITPLSSCTPPAAPSITANNNSQICNNTPVTLTASGCSGTLTWSTGNTGTTLSASTAGTYYATCSANGCTSSASNSINVSNCGATGFSNAYIFGNSFTYTPPLPSIGWNQQNGMAASDLNHDYAHVFQSMMQTVNPSFSMFATASTFEGEYNGIFDYQVRVTNELNTHYNNNPPHFDLIILSISENIDEANFNQTAFFNGLDKLIATVPKASTYTVLLRNSFWGGHTTSSAALQTYATQKGYKFVNFSDIVDKPEYQATQFSDLGVRRHWNDAGHYEIARRMFGQLTSSNCVFTPTATVSNANVTCGASINLTATCSGADCGGVSYAWIGNGISQNGSSINVNAPGSNGSFTYTVTASKANCANKTATTSITVSGCANTLDFVSQTDEGWSGSDMKTITNGIITVGMKKSVGAVICYLAKNADNRNLVNDFQVSDARSDDYLGRQGKTFSDKGRQIQPVSLYFSPGNNWQVTSTKNTNQYGFDTGGNTVQGGSLAQYYDESEVLASRIYTHPKYGQMFYAKIKPRVWGVPREFAHVINEEWIWLNGNAVGTYTRTTVSDRDNSQVIWQARAQEMPCAYVIAPLTYHRAVTATPWTGASTIDRFPSGWAQNAFQDAIITSECWTGAYEGPSGTGVTLYAPGIDRGDGVKIGANSRFTNGQFVGTSGIWSDNASSYINNAMMFNADNPGIYDNANYAIVGTMSEARSKMDALGHPDQTFDFDFTGDNHAWWNLNSRLKKESGAWTAYLGDSQHAEFRTPYRSWDANQIHTIEFDMAVSGITALWVEWKKPGEEHDESKKFRKVINLTGDGTRRTYSFSTSDPNWNGTIVSVGLRSIRQDDSGGNPPTYGGNVKVYRIRKLN